jgi:hypothetical protein
MEGNDMQSTNRGRPYINLKQIASIARRRAGAGATLKAGMTGVAGVVVLVLLFLASLAYVALGGTLALEASPVPEPEATDTPAAMRQVSATAVQDRRLSSRHIMHRHLQVGMVIATS